jgi:hypothetical protein
MTARQRVRANLVNMVFSRALLTCEVLDGLDTVNKAADVRTFGDAVDVGHGSVDGVETGRSNFGARPLLPVSFSSKSLSANNLMS